MVGATQLIVGLTGGMGCGKSTVASIFTEVGFRRIDSDQVIRDEILTRADVVASIRERLGPETINANGMVRRDVVATKVFANPADLAWLENETHPRVMACWAHLLETYPEDNFVIEVPLLFEKGLENWFDFTVCVTSHPATQLRRLELRGVPPEQARQRLVKQLPLARKCELADYVLLNDGSLPFLREQVYTLADRLKSTKPLRQRSRIHVSPS